MSRVWLLLLAALLACARANEDIQVAPQAFEPWVAVSEGGSATLPWLFHGNSPPKSAWKVQQHAQIPQHHTRHKRQGGPYIPASYVIPGGEGSGPWGAWGEVSPCSRTCGGGVASQKRICWQSVAQPQCTGGDTKYFSCQTQDCPDGSGDFRAEQCAEFNDENFRGVEHVNWVPYTKAHNPCELNCSPKGERLYFRQKLKVTDGTRCNDESFDVCVDGSCQPVGCDMMLNSAAREDKCRECRGNGTNCRTIVGIVDLQDLEKGFNDILLIPAGSTSINIEEVAPSNNNLALKAKNGTYYLNGHYHIDFPKTITIAGALWTYERSQQGYAAPDKLRCLGPTNEPLYLSLFLQDENVGIKYEYSVPNNSAPPTDKRYKWVHEQFTLCSALCGGGFQTRDVRCREELEIVEDSLCDEGLKPPTNQSCNPDPCLALWVEGPWGECSQSCGSVGVRSREVTCQIIANGQNSIVPDEECFDLLGPKPKLFQKCNEDAPCPTWFVGDWNPCDKPCDEGKQTRQVVCKQNKDGAVEVLDDKICTEEKPAEEQPCMLQPCDGAEWVTSSWSGCDTCTSKFRTRMVVCSTKDGLAMNKIFCKKLNRPVDQEACTLMELPTCKYQWYTTYWDKCSVNCGVGVQTRKMFCGMYYENESGNGIEFVEDAKCDNLTKYKNTRPCTKECPSQWFAGPWSECSEDGEQYRRVMCFRGYKKANDCDGTTMLNSVQACTREANGTPGPVMLPAGIAGDENATVTGELGSPLQVRCLAYGYPPPSVFWYSGFDEKPILLHNETEYEVRGNDLIIKRLSVDNLGQYSCGAYNGLGPAASWKVVVQACKPEGLLYENESLVSRCAVAPRPSAQPQTTAETTTTTTTTTTEAPTGGEPLSTFIMVLSSTVNVGDFLSLICVVEGFPRPDVHWTKDGETIPHNTSDKRFMFVVPPPSDTSVEFFKMMVQSVSVADSGQYTCHASNQYSSFSSSVQIDVHQDEAPAKQQAL